MSGSNRFNVRYGLIFARLAVSACLGVATIQPAVGDESTSEAGSPQAQHHHGPHGKFGAAMHQCVQAALAKEGIAMPPHQEGQRPVLDDATRAAMHAARKACWQQVNGAPASTN